jgi:hypothetical protein
MPSDEFETSFRCFSVFFVRVESIRFSEEHGRFVVMFRDLFRASYSCVDLFLSGGVVGFRVLVESRNCWGFERRVGLGI